ncbi:MAG: hypothetical protein ACI4JW_00975 [Oscillospiraceae bacterium]
MKRLKQAAAFVAAAAVAASSMAGCSSSTDYCATANGEKINAGIYINYLMNEMTNQMYMMYYSGEITEMSQCFDKQVDGKDFKTYCKDAAMENTKKFAAINAKFDELGLELSAEDIDEIKETVASTWDQSGEFFEYEGVSRESLKQYTELSYKQTAIFNYYYEIGGTEEVTAADVTDYVNTNYIRYKKINVSKSIAEDEETQAAENEEARALVDGYLAEAAELSFEDFDKIIDEYAEYQTAKAEELTAEEDAADEAEDTESDAETETTETEETADESEVSDESAADESEEESLDESTVEAIEEAAEEVEEEAEAEETESTEESQADVTESEADDAEGEDSEEGEAEEEEDPYENEIISDYTTAVDEEDDYYDEDNANMLKAFKDTTYGKAAIYETDDAYVLYITADIAERSDYGEENRETLVHSMKDEEFEQKITEWTEAVKFNANSKAVKRYTVQEVYDRQEEYYSKNS